MNEDLFTLHSIALWKGLVDRALREWIGAAVGSLVVNDIVQRTTQRFLQPIASQLLGGMVHEDAMLPIIHQEDRHGRVVHNGVEAAFEGFHGSALAFQLDVATL
nr:hypothetical protein [Sphingomonas turrisvirgatae]